jgi:hypothetical protein
MIMMPYSWRWSSLQFTGQTDFWHPTGAPRIAGALTLLIDEINATPPAMPGDTRPITYQLTPRPGI